MLLASELMAASKVGAKDLAGYDWLGGLEGWLDDYITARRTCAGLVWQTGTSEWGSASMCVLVR